MSHIRFDYKNIQNSSFHRDFISSLKQKNADPEKEKCRTSSKKSSLTTSSILTLSLSCLSKSTADLNMKRINQRKSNILNS